MGRTWNPAGLVGPALLILAGGCAHLDTGGRNDANGRDLFAELQQAVENTGRNVAPSLAFVNVKGGRTSRKFSFTFTDGKLQRTGGSSSSGQTGIILTPQGHVLIPGVLKPRDIERIEVWVGDRDYTAKVVKADRTLGMTIIKIRSDDTFTPLDLDKLSELKPGSWCVIVTPSDESKDFTIFTTLSVCRGILDERYRKFVLDSSRLPGAEGAPVFDIDGRPAGIIQSRDALSLVDLKDDLKTFLDEATGVTSPEEEARRKGWFGALLLPINKDYARAHHLSKSALWVVHAVRNAPAYKAGVRDGDLIVALNGKPLRLSGSRAQDYFIKALRPRVGNSFTVTVLRDGKTRDCSGTIEKQPEPVTLQAKDLGVTVQAITDADAFSQNLFTTNGVLVTDVENGSPAATSSQFRKGLLSRQDVIVEMAGQPTPTLEAFSRVLESIRGEHPDVLLVVYRRGRITGYAGLNLKIGENGEGDSK